MADADSAHTLKWIGAFRDAHEVCVYSFTAPAAGQRVLEGIAVHLAPADVLHEVEAKGRWWRALRLVKHLRGVVRAFAPDVVHAFNLSSYGVLGSFLGFHPFVVSTLGLDVYHYPRRDAVSRFLTRRVFKKADVLLSTSEVMARECSKYTDKELCITTFGVNTDLFRPVEVERPWGEKSFVVGNIKLLGAFSGQDLLIGAFAVLCERNPEVDCHLVFVGDGATRGELEAQAQRLGIRERVHFEGLKPQEELPRYYSMFDVSVYLSRSESFGVAALESLACGCPVVASRAPGYEETLVDACSIRVSIDSLEAVVGAMQVLLDVPQVREEMSVAGVEHVRTRYSWARSVEEMRAVYRRFPARG